METYIKDCFVNASIEKFFDSFVNAGYDHELTYRDGLSEEDLEYIQQQAGVQWQRGHLVLLRKLFCRPNPLLSLSQEGSFSGIKKRRASSRVSCLLVLPIQFQQHCPPFT